jgi:DNA-binding transcriptional LysR family regulator
MKFQNVKYFLALCDEKKFSRAATRCGIAHPSLTNAIKRLEERFGGVLFDRTRTSTSKTTLTTLALAIKPHLEQAHAAVVMGQNIASRHRVQKTSKHNRARARKAAVATLGELR